MASTKSIAAAIKSIPEKKENLRKAFEVLKSYSSSLPSFNFQWKDLDDHFSSIEKSIKEQFEGLESKEIEVQPALAAKEAERKPDESEADPRPELKSVCVKMDGKGLMSFINDNKREIVEIRNELTAALRSASDPAKLVLDAMDCFYAANKGEKEGEIQANRRTCMFLMQRVEVIGSEIKASVRESAKKLALVWKGKISHGTENAIDALAFLQLLATYGLVSEFKMDEILEILVSVSRRKQAFDLFKSLGLTDNISDFIQKLNSKGRQLDAVKFVYGLNLSDKYPPVPLLKAYVKESKKVAQEVLKKGNNSTQSQNEAIAKEQAALRAVIKAVEEYKLESVYSCEGLQKRIAQLDQQKANKKRAATAPAASNVKTQMQQPQQQFNKRPRPSTATSTPAVASHPLPPLLQTPSQLGLTDRNPYFGLAGSYGLPGTGSLYNHHVDPSPMGLGGNPTPPGPYPYPSESLMGSGLYDRPANYGGYPMSGLPPYSSSLYR